MREHDVNAATFFIAIATEREGGDPEARSRELATAAAADGWDALLEEHSAAWRRLWCRNLVELEARNQERKWYLGQYALFCHAKSGKPAPGLFGVATPYDCPPWHGDRHNNYPEYAMLFWGAFPSNHLDIARNYTEHIHAFLPTARRIAREVFECDGAAFPHLYIDYRDRFYFDNLWSRSLYITALTAQNCWLHYQYSQDEEFLREMAYPVLKEASDFYVSLVAKNPPGCYDLWPTVPCEYRGFLKDLALSRNCIFDVSCVRYLLNAAIRAGEVLNLDEDDRARWRHLLDNLPDYPTMQYKGQTIFADVEGNREFPPYNHPVGISPMFPGQDPECFGEGRWRGIAEATLRCHEWASWPQICYARLGDRQEAFRRSGGSEPLPEQSEDSNVAFGGSFSAFNVAELLMSSWDGVIRVFPAWPLELKAEFEDLRAAGAFLVDAACAEGAVGYVRLRSEKRGVVAIEAPWAEFTVCDGAGAPVRFDLRDGIVRFATEAGGQYILRP